MKAIIGMGSVGTEIAKLWPDAKQIHHDQVDFNPRANLDIRLKEITQAIITFGLLENIPFDKLNTLSPSKRDFSLVGIIDANLSVPIAFVNELIAYSSIKSIVLIGSMAYRRILTGLSIYGAAKAGLAHFIKCAAFELAPKDIKIAGIFPTNIWGTKISQDLINQVGEQHYDASRRLPEKLTVEKVAEYAVQLSDDLLKFPYLTGSIIEFNGGER